ATEDRLLGTATDKEIATRLIGHSAEFAGGDAPWESKVRSSRPSSAAGLLKKMLFWAPSAMKKLPPAAAIRFPECSSDAWPKASHWRSVKTGFGRAQKTSSLAPRRTPRLPPA